MSAGPFETAREVLDALGQRPGASNPFVSNPSPAENELALLRACEQAGVELGAYDRRTIAWLARWEPATVGAIAGMILRASA